ncbi:MAG TPA: thioredoxin domain-containing protein [Croceibacterium sp.]|nr:thioredoxin domain-containing protein [Croceibacterium sp.]
MKPNRIVKRGLLGAGLAGVALMLTAATEPSPGPNWMTTVVLNGTGHRIGNPNAKVRLIEFVSYTCSHCSDFNREAEGALQLGYIVPGKVNVEIRHLIRDPIDLTVTMLAHCGPESKFARNHNAFLSGQPNWMGPLANSSAAQRQRWTAPGAAGRRAIAGDFGLYRIMEQRGYTRTEADRCLAYDALARQLAEESQKDWGRPGIGGTPSFAINGIVMPGTHTWSALSGQLDDFIRQSAN